MLPVVTAAQMQELDRKTIDEVGIPAVVLMENAGRAVIDALELRAGHRIAILAGPGNNGGDGLVIARVLRERGHAVDLYTDFDGIAAYRDRITSAHVVIDALFGTGLKRDVGGVFVDAIAICNEARGLVVSVDMPSGLCATTGKILGCAVRPAKTVTMAFLKVGLAVAPGFAHAGEVVVAEIGISSALASGVQLAMLEPRDVRLAPLTVLAHKGSRGHVLLFAGSPGKRGAARLAATAALRSGAGLVTVCADGAEQEVMPDPVMTKNPSDDLAALLRGKAAVGIGPGMDTGARGKALVERVIAETSVPLLIDADALNHIRPAAVAGRRAPTVLTPHPGEAARLLDSTIAEVERDRVAAARRLASESGAIVVLKGARSLVATPDGFVSINPSGTPAMATAGTGDVLSGCAVALLGSGIPALDATRAAVYLHGRAGEHAERRYGRRSVIATDLVQCLAACFRSHDSGL